MEEIYRELFALREAKLALDQEVMPAPADLKPPSTELEATRWSARKRVTGVPGLSKRGIGTFQESSKRYPRSSLSTGHGALQGGFRGTITRDDDVAQAMCARSSGGGPRRSSERRVLAEMQVDPDLPLPLPTFNGTFLATVAEQQPENKAKGRNSNQPPRLPAGGRSDDPKSARIGGRGNTAGGILHHGYFVPGVVPPQQRQSHVLPQELRAISTIPTPERPLPSSNAGAGTTGTGKRHRARSKSSLARTRRESSPAPPSGPPASATAAALVKRGGGASSPRPEPGSAAALASAREQRRYTSRAVDELRQEMREREGRLERELDRLRQSRSRRTSPANTTPAGVSEPAAKPTPASTVCGKRGTVLASRGRRSKGRSLSRPLVPKVQPVVSRKLVDEQTGDQNDDDVTPPLAPTPAVETADAQAQTAIDGVQLYFQPQPTVRDPLGAIEEEIPQTSPTKTLPSASNTHVQRTERSAENGDGGGHYFDDASFSSSSVSDGGGDLGRQLSRRWVSPPPPVVFIEGEGRNVSWRPSDDDRLLRRSGGGGGEEVMEEAPGLGGARLFTTTGGDGDDGAGEEEGEEVGKAEPREIRVGLLASAGLEPVNPEAHVQDQVWVQLAGMLALSASESTAGLPTGQATAAAGKPSIEKEVDPLEQAATVSPELLNLMREVVGQQKEMGEERSALIQVCSKWQVEQRGVKLLVHV